MQRNMDLVRMIMTRLESSPGGWAPPFGIQSFSPQEIGYHAHIMMQEGLIEAVDVTSTESSGPEAIPTNLTWKGHEFLDLARDQDRWNRTKAVVAKIGGAPLSVWMKVLTELMLQGVDAAMIKAS
ncbi:MAG: DUF2513 domain-containing protein [Gemmataceae bacterium]